MNRFLNAVAATLVMTTGAAISLAPAARAVEAPQWAVDACSSEVAKYGVTATEVIDVITGKGGATLTMNGFNSAGVPVQFVCTYTINTGETVIEYQ